MNIKTAFNKHVEEIGKLFLDYPFENADAYFAWMNQHYYLVQNSTRYICLAASLSDVNDDKTFKHWSHHLSEELDHDKVLLKDMKNIKTSELEPASPETRAIIATQYYDLQKYGSHAILGYALLLEGLSCTIADNIAERIEKSHQRKSGFLLLHGKVDLDHFPDGVAHVETLSKEAQKVVLNNLEVSALLYGYFMKSLAAKHGLFAHKKAA